MKILMIAIVLGISTTVLSGCANLDGIDPSGLEKSTSSSYVEVKNPYNWTQTDIFGENTRYFTLAAGIYKAKFDDGKVGTYFEGNGICLTSKIIRNSDKAQIGHSAERCGLYVPNNTNERIKVYHYADSEANREALANAGPLIGAVGRSEESNLFVLMHQPDENALNAALKVIK